MKLSKNERTLNVRRQMVLLCNNSNTQVIIALYYTDNYSRYPSPTAATFHYLLSREKQR